MEKIKSAIIECIEKIIEQQNFKGISFAEMYTGPNRSKIGFISPCQRFTYVVKGDFHVNIGSAATLGAQHYRDGNTLIMKPFCFSNVIFDSPHETVGIVLFPEYLRVFHVDYHGGQSLIEPTHCYHVRDSVRKCTIHAINTLCSLNEGPDLEELEPYLLKVVFSMIRTDLRNASGFDEGRAYFLWTKISEYVSNTITEEQTRRNVASHFCVSESYISRLFTAYAKMTYKEYVRQLRLQMAQQLLIQTEMSIAEISYQCGFDSCSYFIKQFRTVYGVSPGFQRRLKK